MAGASSSPRASALQPTDLELHLLQSFGAFASEKVVASYLYVKHRSRVLGFLASTTERVVTKTGLVGLVGMIFAQYQRLGHPLVQAVDDAMGRRIINAFVNILLLAKQQQEQEQEQEQEQDNQTQTQAQTQARSMDAAAHSLESDSGAALKLSYQERIQALLQGQVPRLQELLVDASPSLQAAAAPTSPVVIHELEDFVPKEEVTRLARLNQEQVAAMQTEMAALQQALRALECEKQQLEQDLTDVHNYQESERGVRFREMEEELARTKLEANQKAHDLRKMELVVDAFRRKRKSGRSSRSTAAPSVTSSDGQMSPQNGASPVAPV